MVPFSILKEHQGRGVCTPMLIHVDVSQKSTQDCKPIISQLKIIFFLKRASLQPLLPSPRILFLLLTSCFPFTKTLTIFSGPTRYFCMISSSKDLYLSHLQSPFCHEGSIFIGSRDTMQPFGGKELILPPPLLCGASGSIRRHFRVSLPTLVRECWSSRVLSLCNFKLPACLLSSLTSLSQQRKE